MKFEEEKTTHIRIEWRILPLLDRLVASLPDVTTRSGGIEYLMSINEKWVEMTQGDMFSEP